MDNYTIARKAVLKAVENQNRQWNSLKGMFVDGPKISDSSNLEEDLKLDSLDEIEILMFIEEELEIDIHDSKVIDLKTVYDLIEIVESILGEKNGT